jgi:hypothetical protein
MKDNKHELNVKEYLSKQLLWYAVISWFEDNLNPIQWSIFDNVFLIIIFLIFQLFVLGTCVTETKIEN